jgi:hypothetical protein
MASPNFNRTDSKVDEIEKEETDGKPIQVELTDETASMSTNIIKD